MTCQSSITIVSVMIKYRAGMNRVYCYCCCYCYCLSNNDNLTVKSVTTVLCPVTVAIPLSQQQRQSHNSLVSEAFHDEVGRRSGHSGNTPAVGSIADTQRHPCAQPLEVRVVVLLFVLIGLTGSTAARNTPKEIRQKRRKKR